MYILFNILYNTKTELKFKILKLLNKIFFWYFSKDFYSIVLCIDKSKFFFFKS